MIRRLLIANRGEIVVRIARTAREMGIWTIGVFSEADQRAYHVEHVDEAHLVGPAPSKESYLRQDKLMEIADAAGADAIHPGYGFLSENAEFAQRVLDQGIVWVGPPPSAIAAMGSKTGARSLMRKAGVPVVPGSDGSLRTVVEAEDFARSTGFPVLLKAVAGGGGKGMRIVKTQEELRGAFESAQREALAAFGDGSVYAEKFLEHPRHIEVQVFADAHKNVIQLGERECSLQRRHQKIIEESPSVVVSEKLRASMGATAVAAARACGYENAGTVEMMLDRDGQFYFLEMNTRLQVEHPVTEAITGIDLVRLQLAVAAGETLPYKQDDITRRGHAIEVRIYAEDVPGGFLPSTGTIEHMRLPGGPGVRVDSGLREGGEVSRHYDPMIAKLIVCAETREAAQQRMVQALQEYEIAGVRTNIAFCRFVLGHPAFARGEFHTQSVDEVFLADYRASLDQTTKDEPVMVALASHLFMKSEPLDVPPATVELPRMSPWTTAGRRRALRD